MANRVYNFNPGPSTLPLEVLQKAQSELLDYRGTGMSIMESSHRSAEYDEVNESTMTLVRDLFGLDDSYHVMFLTGGASSQFYMIPMNFLTKGEAAYVDTGSWSTKAIKEAKLFGDVKVAASSKEDDYKYIPKMDDIKFGTDSAYLHITTNNTIKGTQFHSLPDTGKVPLIADMSSDIASRRMDFSRFSMIYAGAQKNLGPSGVTLVIMRDDLLQQGKDGLPTMLTYKTHAEKKSLYNTPPTFGVYLMKLVLEWIRDNGGLGGMEKINAAKKDRIYELIDSHPDFFRGTVEKDSRSWMNITLRLPSEELEKQLITEAKSAGFIGLKGHRSVGGIRVSLYNAMTLEGAEKLAAFMEDFRKKN
ncbi:3-phosphoserine/phosphohydroxythreonine transaminase [candidate division GN15 bacterium]|nr:3-phosphoserine/phosphohydroxythreonine transaminase [candidate division GN15 bacterium]